MTEQQYLTGFDNEHETEAVKGALPEGQFSPQQHPLGLYAEQLSTTAFTAPRHNNRRTWCYRIQPSVSQGKVQLVDQQSHIETAPIDGRLAHEALRWSPPVLANDPGDFIDSLTTMMVNGDARMQSGVGVHTYACNREMTGRYFYSADGELLIIPVGGDLQLRTELGLLDINAGEIAVIPRGIRFQANPVGGVSYGYIAENYGAPLTLPERGPVGANGFANDRDFLYPVAAFEVATGSVEIIGKFGGQLYRAEMDHSPLNVVAWAGNSAPYKYDLARFNAMNTVTFDHPDPSIFTVLTSPSDTLGVANLDFVIFPPRWIVADNTFRPPWYHRNIMSECMGLIEGHYDAKKEGFEPGGMSLHNAMTPHGPDRQVYETASTTELKPTRIENSLAFMLESRYPFTPTSLAMKSDRLQAEYENCWQGLEPVFEKE